MSAVKKRRKTGRGALFLVSAMLISSGLLRLGAEHGQALAEALTKAAEPVPVLDMNTEALRNDLESLMVTLRDREARLDRRAEQIEDRMRALRLVEEQIDQKLAELKTAEEGLSATLSLVETAAETDLARLTSVYENMKPKDAAALFEEMAPEFAAGFLGRMRPDAAAKILTGLTPPTAYSISVILAGRNARAPSQ